MPNKPTENVIPDRLDEDSLPIVTDVSSRDVQAEVHRLPSLTEQVNGDTPTFKANKIEELKLPGSRD